MDSTSIPYEPPKNEKMKINITISHFSFPFILCARNFTPSNKAPVLVNTAMKATNKQDEKNDINAIYNPFNRRLQNGYESLWMRLLFLIRALEQIWVCVCRRR